MKLFSTFLGGTGGSRRLAGHRHGETRLNGILTCDFLLRPVGSGAAFRNFSQRGVIPRVKSNDDTSCVFPGRRGRQWPTFSMSFGEIGLHQNLPEGEVPRKISGAALRLAKLQMRRGERGRLHLGSPWAGAKGTDEQSLVRSPDEGGCASIRNAMEQTQCREISAGQGRSSGVLVPVFSLSSGLRTFLYSQLPLSC